MLTDLYVWRYLAYLIFRSQTAFLGSSQQDEKNNYLASQLTSHIDFVKSQLYARLSCCGEALLFGHDRSPVRRIFYPQHLNAKPLLQ